MFALFFSAICAWFAYFLPCFASYKILATRPINEAELERISMYWTVVGAFVGVEYCAEWLVSWVPFYWEVKTVFLLFLSLPQIQGSTFIYQNYLQPFFAKNEAHIDSGIISMQSSVIAFAKTRLAMLWDLLWSVINKNTAANGQAGQPSAPGAAPPVNLQSALGLLQNLAPALVSSMQQSKAAAPPAAPAAAAEPQVAQ
ncbi:TB2/DP1, HVA22 family-domain-containing protein [Mycena floridula]|nr:TB2/DP1, HVA22 family-domain-containing protein [Mycena floridula]